MRLLDVGIDDDLAAGQRGQGAAAPVRQPAALEGHDGGVAAVEVLGVLPPQREPHLRLRLVHQTDVSFRDFLSKESGLLEDYIFV